MRSSISIVIPVLLTAAALAGCIGGDDAPADDPGEAPPAAGMGTVTGTIFTINLEPIQNARVAIVLDDTLVAETETDSSGDYTLRNVEPGDYRLQVSAACCRENVRPVTVLADEVVTVDLQLELFTSDDLQEPRVERYEWTGFLACTLRWHNPEGPHHNMSVFGIPGGASGLNACGLAPEATDDDFLHDFQIGRGLETIVGGMVWQAPGAALGDELNLLLEVNERWNVPPRYAQVEGHAPIEFRVDAGYVLENYDEEVDDHDIHQYDFSNVEASLTLAYRIFAGGMVNVVYQVQFTVYWDLYYWEPAPETATALPDR